MDYHHLGVFTEVVIEMFEAGEFSTNITRSPEEEMARLIINRYKELKSENENS